MTGWNPLEWPSALLVRHVFRGGGERTAASMATYEPDGIDSRLDLAYGADPAERLDVHRPAGADGPLPVVVWAHGGGWVGGDKSEVRTYLQILAAQGHAVVGINYTRAPSARHPTPARQTSAALLWLAEHAEELGLDPGRVVLAGDSAGAQVAAQLAAAMTSPAYALALGLEAPLPSAALRGVVLDCGAYDPGRLAEGGAGLVGFLTRTTVRSYLGRPWQEAAAQAKVLDHVGPDFPRTWISAGNDDGLQVQGHALAERLRELGVDVTALFYPTDHRPSLGHEYQFDLAGADGPAALRSTIDFLADAFDLSS
ncbi:alpha/beta hydrolase [Aeromicrobium sp. CF4.19]|uniref:alpha/beta hydrolase n=1 Tax=Aeromicrobium sp. CF4.19 TaxID=3373082 RepID=UPI003EE59462